MLGINCLGSGPRWPCLGAQTGGGVRAGPCCPCPHRGFADEVWPLMRGAWRGALQHPGMILGWPKNLCVAGEGISRINVVPGGSPALRPGESG